MASQRDFFRDSDDSSRVKGKKKVSASYDATTKRREFLYEEIILFNWDPDSRTPFSSHKLTIFSDKEIKPEWISKSLGVNSRISKLRNLSPFPGQVMSLFSKIELGNCIHCHYFKILKINIYLTLILLRGP